MIWYFVRNIKHSKHTVTVINCAATHSMNCDYYEGSWIHHNGARRMYFSNIYFYRDWLQVKSAEMEDFVHSTLALAACRWLTTEA